MAKFIQLSFIGLLVVCSAFGQLHWRSSCYDRAGRPQRCVPMFENIALNREIQSTNTCGENGPTPYCEIASPNSGSNQRTCKICQGEDYSTEFLTDEDGLTWWQSETLQENVGQVNLTLSLNKTYDITFIRLRFQSPRPANMAIYKRTTPNGPWIPFQYFSLNCSNFYGKQDINSVEDPSKETEAFCTSGSSDITPIQGGVVAFSTLEGRPSAYNFEESPKLQDWIAATDIRISLDHVNTFGDEVFEDPDTLKSYYYAISDISVGGRCHCNGHAEECVTTDEGGNVKHACKCEHNTTGENCEMCKPSFNDQPWGRANVKNVHACKECNCNGFSDECYFDETLHKTTGHGGHCQNCRDNRAGVNCEHCEENYVMMSDGACLPAINSHTEQLSPLLEAEETRPVVTDVEDQCVCNEIGATSPVCNPEGKCVCKLGVSGDKCDKCETNFLYFGGTLTCLKLRFSQWMLS